MNSIKCITLSMLLLTALNSHSQFTLVVIPGFNCYHNGEYYAFVTTNMSCPVPGFVLWDDWGGGLDRLDPNDHESVITRVASAPQ